MALFETRRGIMYRAITPLLLLATITAAPQDTTVPKEAQITNIKTQPITDSIPAPSYRSPQIEIVPLGIGSSEILTEDDILDTSEDISTVQEPSTVGFESSETEAVTEKYERTTASEIRTTPYEIRTTVYEPKTKVPKFYSKLSYFAKSNNDNHLLTNLVERPGRRKFRSRCRCERISNCPKLQITVPRCPEEQFLCCF